MTGGDFFLTARVCIDFVSKYNKTSLLDWRTLYGSKIIRLFGAKDNTCFQAEFEALAQRPGGALSVVGGNSLYGDGTDQMADTPRSLTKWFNEAYIHCPIHKRLKLIKFFSRYWCYLSPRVKFKDRYNVIPQNFIQIINF